MGNDFLDYSDPTSQKGLLYGVITNGVFLALLIASFATGLVSSPLAIIENGLLIIVGVAIGSGTVFLFRRSEWVSQAWNKFSFRLSFIFGFIIIFQILDWFYSAAFSIVLILLVGALVGDITSRIVLYFRIGY